MSIQSTPAGRVERRIAPAGIIVVAIGVVLVVIALFALDWLSASSGGFTLNLKFSDLRDSASGNLTGLDGAYFSWLAYVTAAVTAVFAVLATIPQAAQMASKAIAAVAGVFGIVISFVVFSRVHIGAGDRGVGFWLFVVGLAVLVGGALIPSRPVVTYIAGYGMPTQQDKFASPYAGAPPVQPYQPYGAVPPPVAAPAPAFGQPPAAAWGATPATSTTPPGWQPDPTGRNQYRYWDGNAWSAHVSNAGVQATDPVSSTGPT